MSLLERFQKQQIPVAEWMHDAELGPVRQLGGTLGAHEDLVSDAA